MASNVKTLEDFLIANQHCQFKAHKIKNGTIEIEQVIQICTIEDLDPDFSKNYKAAKNFIYYSHTNSCSFSQKEYDCVLTAIPVPKDKWGNTATYHQGLKLQKGYYSVGFYGGIYGDFKERLSNSLKSHLPLQLQPKEYFIEKSIYHKIPAIGWKSIEKEFLNWLLDNHEKYDFISKTVELDPDWYGFAQATDGFDYFNWCYFTTNCFFDSDQWQSLFKDFENDL